MEYKYYTVKTENLEIGETVWIVPGEGCSGIEGSWERSGCAVTEKKRWRVCEVFLSVMAILAAAWGILPPASPGEAVTVIYVTQTGAGLRNGTSWSNACGEAEFKTALDNAPAGSEIWVAKGKYRPSIPAAGAPADREASFALKSGVTLYGGFAGGETNTRQRDFRKNVTVLTGDLAGDDTVNGDGVTETAAGIQGQNSYTVVSSFGAAAPNTGILDGFTITGGSADWTDTNTGGAKQYGGGMHNTGSKAVVRNCSFRGNTAEWGGGAIYNASSNIRLGYCTFSGNGGRSGAAMYNVSSSPELVSCTFSDNAVRTDAGAIHNYNGSSPVISGCTFTGNRAEWDGGAIANVDDCSPEIINCTFSDNTARGDSLLHLGGGAIASAGSSNAQITNCTFSGNIVEDGFGGAITNAHSTAVIVNCTFSGNSSTSGGAMFNFNCSPSVVNCTFANNSADTAAGMRNSGGGTPVVKNCIFWNNSGQAGNEIVNDTGSVPAVSYCVVRYGYAGGTNVAGNPNLGTLKDNGGYTKTHALLLGSSAIDKGTSAGAPSSDQRGYPRPQGSAYDIGSYEFAPSSDSGGCSALPSGGMAAVLLLAPLLLLFGK